MFDSTRHHVDSLSCAKSSINSNWRVPFSGIGSTQLESSERLTARPALYESMGMLKDVKRFVMGLNNVAVMANARRAHEFDSSSSSLARLTKQVSGSGWCVRSILQSRRSLNLVFS